MRRFLIILLLALCPAAFAGEYKLTTGDVINGEPSSFTAEGVAFRLSVGGFSPRIQWGRFTQESLKELAANPRGKQFAEPFIEVPIEVKRQRTRQKEIVVKEPPVIERPAAKTSFFSSFTTPVGLGALAVLFIANLFAAFEIALFRNQSVPIVMAVSAILPIIGPLIFLCMPSPASAESYDAAPAAGAEPVVAAEAPKAAGAAGGLGLAAHTKSAAGGAASAGQTFKRGDTTFNRRFFETQFSNWFRLVPSDAEKDLVLAIRTPKGEIVGKRISRISMNEMHLALRTGGEASVTFSEIAEVQVRHKDAK
ncbi:MAG TPA: hypothetical protein VEH27_13810 [Methylomirabilota bacterium]|nr:hypothetical protein [Methylomirabilota bacterium]